MLSTWPACYAALFSFAAFAAADLPSAAKTKIAYARDIEPRLAERGYVCHAAQQRATQPLAFLPSCYLNALDAAQHLLAAAPQCAGRARR